MMKNFFALLVICFGAASSLYGQEIIPFPDLSESHIAVYNQKEVFDDHNYSLFKEDYQEALRKVDREISALEAQIETSTDAKHSASLESQKVDLNKKRSKLLEEAELADDLNKFY
jgi:hypothetical protein